jgi:hypothetical protein
MMHRHFHICHGIPPSAAYSCCLDFKMDLLTCLKGMFAKKDKEKNLEK